MLLEYLTSPNIYLNICLQFTFKITILCRIWIWNLSDWSFTDGSLFLTLNYVHHSPTYQSQINWLYVQNCMFKTYWFRLNSPFNFTKSFSKHYRIQHSGEESSDPHSFIVTQYEWELLLVKWYIVNNSEEVKLN